VRFDTLMMREIQVFWDMRKRIVSKVLELFTVLHVTYHKTCLFANPVMALTGACEVCEMFSIYVTEALLCLCSRQALSFFFFGMYSIYIYLLFSVVQSFLFQPLQKF